MNQRDQALDCLLSSLLREARPVISRQGSFKDSNIVKAGRLQHVVDAGFSIPDFVREVRIPKGKPEKGVGHVRRFQQQDTTGRQGLTYRIQERNSLTFRHVLDDVEHGQRNCALQVAR